MKKLASMFTVLMLASVLSFAQTRPISGRVVDQNGAPVANASVTVKGSSNGVAADVDGNFRINAKTGDVLVISAVNAQNQTMTVGSGSTVLVSMNRTGQNLSEVVVTTALGIRRKADVLSYATQGIKSDKLTTTRITDVNNALAGKIAGVQVRSESGAKLGSAGTVLLRGAGAVLTTKEDGTRQTVSDLAPLYVLDGTPVAAQDINPDDVDDIQVLKGPAATALYGQRAQNGVIMVTSKKGNRRAGIGVDVTSTYTVEKIGLLPQFQNDYAGGTLGTPGQEWHKFTWDASMPAEWKNLDGKYYHTYYDDASWGPRISGQEYIPWYAWYGGHQYSYKTAKLTPQPNNIKQFWNKNGAGSAVNTVSFARAGDAVNFRLSYTNIAQKGLLPNTTYGKNYVAANVSYDLNSHLTAGVNFNYMTDRLSGEFDDDYGNASSGSFSQWFHRDLDMNIMRELRGLRTPEGGLPSWNLNDANGINGLNSLDPNAFLRPNYWFNHFSYFDNISNVTRRNRTFGDINLTYKFNQHFKLAVFVRKNQYQQNREWKVPNNMEISNDAQSTLANNADNTGRPIKATYGTRYEYENEDNYEFLGTYNQKFGDFAVDFNVGGNDRRNNRSYVENQTRGGLTIPELYTLNNSVTQPFDYSNARYAKRVLSLYGRGGINYKDIAILDFSVRNDISSALPKGNNSYTYPSIGGSFIFTKFLQKSLPAISFGKIRASYAQIGSDLPAYQTVQTYALNANQWNGNILTAEPNLQLTSNIKPALSNSYEVGADLRFLKNRLGLTVTYYEQRNKDQIIDVSIPAASGYDRRLINAGRIDRYGVEVTLDGRPVATKDFSWDVTVNYARNRSRVVELAEGITSIYQAGGSYTSGTGNAAYAPGVWNIVGESFGQLRGTGIKKYNGIPVLNANGTYVREDNVNFGSILPDYTGGVINSFKYKDFNLSVVIDFAKGGKYYSLSDFWGKVSGLYTATAGVNDKGNPIRDAVADGGGVHVVGVDDDSTKHNVIDKYVEAGTYWTQFSNSKINENSVFDLDYVKVRELSFGYKLPLSKMGKFGSAFQNITVTALVRNPLLIYSKNRNIDPSELVGGYGEAGQLPPSRSYGVTLKLGF